MDKVLVIGNNVDLKKYDFNNKYVIGIDKGTKLCLDNGIVPKMAVGDFDSVNKEEYNFISKNVKDIIKLNCIKDDTDTFHAISNIDKSDNIIILGGIQGNRIEHFYANMKLFSIYPNLVIMDDFTKISLVKNNTTVNESNSFYSFFAIEEVSNLILKGFKYPLNKYHLKVNDSLCISNELIDSEGSISFTKGKLLLFLTKK